MDNGIDVTKTANGAIITVKESSLIGNSVDTLKLEALDLINHGAKKITLDLAKTKYIDSSGIGKILFINKKINSIGGELDIDKISPTLLEFFETLAIDKIIKIKK